MEKEDWNKFVKVFKLDVGVTVKKEVCKADVILALLDDGEIAFNFGNHKGVLKINKAWNLELINNLIWKPIEEYKDKLNKSEEKNE